MRYTPSNTSAIGRPVRVFVDGEEVYQVVECDTSEGWARAHKMDKDGQVILSGDEIETENHHGLVTVEDL